MKYLVDTAPILNITKGPFAAGSLIQMTCTLRNEGAGTVIFDMKIVKRNRPFRVMTSTSPSNVSGQQKAVGSIEAKLEFDGGAAVCRATIGNLNRTSMEKDIQVFRKFTLYNHYHYHKCRKALVNC